MGIGVLGYYFELLLDVFVALGYHICFGFGLCIFDFGPSLFYLLGLGFVSFGLIYIGLVFYSNHSFIKKDKEINESSYIWFWKLKEKG